jgi:hypothetical protein
MPSTIDLIDPRLFGNDAAEDEQKDVFLAHALERAELARFANPSERTSVDDGLTWEVHPVFRQSLEMRDTSGMELRRPKRRRS